MTQANCRGTRACRKRALRALALAVFVPAAIASPWSGTAGEYPLSVAAEDNVLVPAEAGIDGAAEGLPVTPGGVDPALETAVRQALRHYPSVSSSRSAISASRAEVRAARWLQYPSVTVEAVTRDDRIGSVSPTLQIEQPLWAGGRITGAIARAEAIRGVAEARLDETILDLSLRTAAAYFDLLRARRLEIILRDSVAQHQRLVESMQRRVEQEVSPRVDLDLATSRAAQVEQELSLVVAQKLLATERLRELTGIQDLQTDAVYSDQVHHPDPTGIADASVQCSPVVRRLGEEVKVAEADRRISRAAVFPRVGIQYSHDRFNGDQIGLAVRAQTSGGLSPLAAADAARFRRDAAELQVDVAQRETRQATILDLVENTAARERMSASQSAAAAAANVTDSYMRQFITGRRTWLDVMNAVREANAARVALAEAEVSAMSTHARLLLRACRWQPQPADEALP